MGPVHLPCSAKASICMLVVCVPHGYPCLRGTPYFVNECPLDLGCGCPLWPLIGPLGALLVLTLIPYFQ